MLKHLGVDLHEQLERVVSEVVDLAAPSRQSLFPCKASEKNEPVPVSVRVDEEGREDERKDGLDVLADEVDDVLVVPVVQRALGDLQCHQLPHHSSRGRPKTHLEMLTAHAPRQLLKEALHDLLELGRLDHVQDLLDLVEEHDLLGRVDLGPVLEQAIDDLLRQTRVLLEELNDAVRQLRVVQGESLDLVQRNEDAREERLVLLLERERETVDYGAEDLEQLGDPVVALRLVDELEEDVVDRPTDEGAEVEEFAVDSVEGRLEEVALAGILAVEEFEELQRSQSGLALAPSSPTCASGTHLENKLLVDEALGDVGVEVGALDEAKEELVDDLQVRPRELEHGFVLLGVVGVASGVDGGRDGSEEVGRELGEVDEGQLRPRETRRENAPWRRLRGRRSR